MTTNLPLDCATINNVTVQFNRKTRQRGNEATRQKKIQSPRLRSVSVPSPLRLRSGSLKNIRDPEDRSEIEFAAFFIGWLAVEV